ncbi:MAG: metallopeptidase family protein [Mariprofundaceae bacterium]
MTLDDLQRMAEAELARLPAHVLGAMTQIVIVVEEWPDAATLREMGIADPLDLLGLYRGWPLPEREANHAGQPPDVVHLYLRPILAYAEAHGEPVDKTVRDTLIHEIGHYFGFSDAAMAAIERAGEEERDAR